MLARDSAPTKFPGKPAGIHCAFFYTLSYDLDSHGAVRRMQVSVRDDVFREEEFRDIQEADAFYTWLRGVVGRVFI